VSEISKIFNGLSRRFNKSNVKAERSYYFSLGEDEKWTVHVRREECVVERGRNDEADVFFKGPAELFLDVWNGEHELGPRDFLTGRVRSNKPLLLKEFVAAFQKSEAKPGKR
jgi:putative sterol carrier protein